MKCRYCGFELKRIENMNATWEICKCNLSEEDWSLNLKIESLQKQLIEYKHKLSELREQKARAR